jgi:hypothetical protein
MSRHSMAFLLATLLLGSACTYNPPPEVTLVGPANKHFVVGEPIVLQFSEPVRMDSLEVRVWPGQKDLYDVEGERLPGVEPVLATCTASKCGEGVKLTFLGDMSQAQIEVAPGALGKPGQPLVLEVTGALADKKGHAKKVSRFFDFQIVESVWNPYADVAEGDGSGEDVVAAEPLGVTEGSFLMHADFTSPIKLSQQFFCDLRVNQYTGDFVLLLTDADPVDGAPNNTNKPEELLMDTGDEGFIFVIQGRIERDAEEGLVFEGEPVTLTQTIGPITFELRDMVTAGRIDESGETARWDGTLAVKEVYYEVGGNETIYPSDQANFEVFELLPAQVPEGMARVCDDDPCAVVGGRCDLLPEWPPATVCADTE